MERRDCRSISMSSVVQGGSWVTGTEGLGLRRVIRVTQICVTVTSEVALVRVESRSVH